jgi:hypothetical protein
MHVMVPSPEYPSSHTTSTSVVVVPVMLLLSLMPEFATCVAPHVAAVQLTVVSHAEVVAPVAVHDMVPSPEYPSSHCTDTVWVVVPDTSPASLLSENGTWVALHVAAVHVTDVKAGVSCPTTAWHVVVPPPK